MTAVTATLQHPRSGPAAARWVLFSLIITLAASAALLAGSIDAAAQEATATPTVEELQQLRDQAIADGDQQLELTFQEYNDSGVEGTATLYDLGDNQTLVAIAIEGGGEAHPAHIHEGTCGNSEPEPFKDLTTVDDTGESLSLVDVALTDLIDGGDYTVDLHLSPSELGTLVVCANIEGTTTAAPPAAGATATIAPTGEGGQTETATATETAAATQTATAEQTATATTEATATAPATATATVAPTGEGGQAKTPTTTATEAATGGKGETVDGTGGAQAAPETVASLPLADYSGLGVTGTVTLVATDDSTTRVTITLEGDAVTGDHIAHLHRGTCDNLQDDGTIYLATVGADGVSSTTVEMPLRDLISDGWSVNVHRSEADWDTWLVCGYLGDATIGMTGVTSITPAATGGTTTTPTPANVVSAADGTSGVGGKGEPVAPSTVPQGVGVGSALPWPDSPALAIAWSLGIFALVLAAAGIFLRRAGEHDRQPTRWHRLGL
jgi:hypothetical protein